MYITTTEVWATPEFAPVPPSYSVALCRARTGRMIRDGYSRLWSASGGDQARAPSPAMEFARPPLDRYRSVGCASNPFQVPGPRDPR